MRKVHVVKSVMPYFRDRQRGVKTFEIRKNDREYDVGDILIERLWNPEEEAFVGAYLYSEIIYMTSFEQKKGYVVMAMKEATAETFANISIMNYDEERF